MIERKVNVFCDEFLSAKDLTLYANDDGCMRKRMEMIRNEFLFFSSSSRTAVI